MKLIATVSRTGRTAKYPAHMKKNNEKAATTARVSRGSMGASRVSKAPSGEFVVVVIGREYTGLYAWNRAKSGASLGFSQARVLG